MTEIVDKPKQKKFSLDGELAKVDFSDLPRAGLHKEQVAICHALEALAEQHFSKKDAIRFACQLATLSKIYGMVRQSINQNNIIREAGLEEYYP